MLFFKKKAEEKTLFEESPLQKYASGESNDKFAVYQILGPEYLDNKTNFENLFLQTKQMMQSYSQLKSISSETKSPEKINICQIASSRTTQMLHTTLKVLWTLAYYGYQTDFLLKQYSKRRNDLPALSRDEMLQESTAQNQAEECKGVSFEQYIDKMSQLPNVPENPPDNEFLTKFFAEMF